MFHPHSIYQSSEQLSSHILQRSSCKEMFIISLIVRQLFRNILSLVRHRPQIRWIGGFLPHLTDFLPAGFKLYLPVVDFQLFRDDLERDVHWGEIKESLKRSKDLRLCTSSLMRVSTACFSASLMQIESRTWLPVFTTSLPVDMFFTLQVSSYCWGERLHVQYSTWYILTKSASFTQFDTRLLVTHQ